MRFHRGPSGFTLADTVVSLGITSVLILAIAMFLADNQRAFNKTYAGTFSSACEDAQTARAVFHKTIRQACSTAGTASVASDGSWIEVQHYSSPALLSPDRYARFEVSEQNLLLRKGVLGTGQTLLLETVCRNVESARFSLVGGSAQMFLTLDDGDSSQTVNTCATMRNP